MSAEPAVPFTEAYETLRAWSLSRPHPLPRPSGLAVVLCQGLPAWLMACSTWQPSIPAPQSLLSTSAAEHPPTVAAHPTLILVLATMVMSVHREDPS
jgi:hypothetical protein